MESSLLNSETIHWIAYEAMTKVESELLRVVPRTDILIPKILVAFMGSTPRCRYVPARRKLLSIRFGNS
jgi:hypothetical protein